MPLSTTTPFALLDDAREQGASAARLYSNPSEVIRAENRGGVATALEQLREAQRSGLHAAGFITYEAGHALEPRLAGIAREPALPLLWFGLFDTFETIAPEDVSKLFADPAGAWAGRPRPRTDRAEYSEALGNVKDYISAGDIYQANLSFRAEVQTLGDPLALYAGLRQRAQAGYGGVVWTGDDWLLSLSPELFFALHDGKVTTKPMKGTAARGADDAAMIEELRNHPKQRAENLMIVDLLRNDLSRVAKPGSVAVPHLFTVETYPTIHTMTSTVTAQLAEGLRAVDIVSAIFPCGSITGAPKIRAMEIIDELEQSPRGVYTGSIGRIDPDGNAAFNVAIRTLHIKAKESRATIGLGGGIVADSQMAEEWDECLTKGRFVADPRTFDLIETMRFDPEHGIPMLERHLARMKASAEAFDFAFDRHAARNDLQAATFRLVEPKRIRMLVSRSGTLAIEVGAARAWPKAGLTVALVPLPVDPADFRLRHKLTDRAFYEQSRRASGCDECVFVTHDGYLTEGSISTVFVERNGVLLTPPLSRGLIPGVLRAELIDTGKAREAELRVEYLAHGFMIGNASRGLCNAILA